MDYISFFKHHFAKLSAEHSKWAVPQVTSIVKLLWKKKKQSSKGTTHKLRATKPLSGRRYFRKVKHMTAEEGVRTWKRLPLESRILWNQLGDPSLTVNAPKSRVGTMKLSPMGQSEPSRLTFMKMRMM